jgi:hypothetical protein
MFREDTLTYAATAATQQHPHLALRTQLLTSGCCGCMHLAVCLQHASAPTLLLLLLLLLCPCCLGCCETRCNVLTCWWLKPAAL